MKVPGRGAAHHAAVGERLLPAEGVLRPAIACGHTEADQLMVPVEGAVEVAIVAAAHRDVGQQEGARRQVAGHPDVGLQHLGVEEVLAVVGRRGTLDRVGVVGHDPQLPPRLGRHDRLGIERRPRRQRGVEGDVRREILGSERGGEQHGRDGRGEAHSGKVAPHGYTPGCAPSPALPSSPSPPSPSPTSATAMPGSISSKPGVYDRDFGRMLRVVGYLPLWMLLGGALWLQTRDRRRALLLALTPALGGLAAEVLKILLRRERPGLHDGAYFFRPFSDQPCLHPRHRLAIVPCASWRSPGLDALSDVPQGVAGLALSRRRGARSAECRRTRTSSRM